jgi:hypothetical protein
MLLSVDILLRKALVTLMSGLRSDGMVVRLPVAACAELYTSMIT